MIVSLRNWPRGGCFILWAVGNLVAGRQPNIQVAAKTVLNILSPDPLPHPHSRLSSSHSSCFFSLLPRPSYTRLPQNPSRAQFQMCHSCSECFTSTCPRPPAYQQIPYHDLAQHSSTLMPQFFSFVLALFPLYANLDPFKSSHLLARPVFCSKP